MNKMIITDDNSNDEPDFTVADWIRDGHTGTELQDAFDEAIRQAQHEAWEQGAEAYADLAWSSPSGPNDPPANPYEKES